MPKFMSDELVKIGEKVLGAAGSPAEKAELVSKMLVDANLTGHDSHGIIRLKQYVNQIRTGLIDPVAEPELEIDYPSYAKVKGNRAFGQVVARFGIKAAIEKAALNGMAMVGCCHMAHVGRLGDYVSMAAESDLMALAICNGGGPNVAPYGGKQRILGTNPIACAVPIRDGQNIQIDFASAATAEGKLNVAVNKKETVKSGLIIGKEGNPTVDPNDFYNDGAILPIGEHKGSALSLLLEIFGGIFTGGGCSVFPNYLDGNGILFFVMKPDLFRTRKDFETDVKLLSSKVVNSEAADGFREIYFPGQVEQLAHERLSKHGINLDDETWAAIRSIANELSVSI